MNRESIEVAADYEIEKVPVPEWCGDVFIRSMDAGDKIDFVTQCDGDPPEVHLACWLCARMICDEKGNRLFTESDMDIFRAKNPDVVQRIGEEIVKLGRISSDAVRDAEKN